MMAAGDLALEPIFTEISLPEHVTGEQLKALDNFKITVVAEPFRPAALPTPPMPGATSEPRTAPA